GAWEPDVGLTRRLAGSRGIPDAPPFRLTFRNDPKVLASAPLRYRELFADKRILQAGTPTCRASRGGRLREESGPFVLLEHEGGALLFTFRAREEVDWTEQGEHQLNLARGKDAQQDLLFLSTEEGGGVTVALRRARRE